MWNRNGYNGFQMCISLFRHAVCGTDGLLHFRTLVYEAALFYKSGIDISLSMLCFFDDDVAPEETLE
jgi:hypothetical protein